jgi:hypothetical protein
MNEHIGRPILPAGIRSRRQQSQTEERIQEDHAAQHVVKLASIEFAADAIDLVELVVLISLG